MDLPIGLVMFGSKKRGCLLLLDLKKKGEGQRKTGTKRNETRKENMHVKICKVGLTSEAARSACATRHPRSSNCKSCGATFKSG